MVNRAKLGLHSTAGWGRWSLRSLGLMCLVGTPGYAQVSPQKNPAVNNPLALRAAIEIQSQERNALALAILPPQEDPKATHFVVQGGEPGQNVRLVLGNSGPESAYWPLGQIRLDGDGEGHLALDLPQRHTDLFVQAWAQQGLTWWPGPRVTFTQTMPLQSATFYSVYQADGMVITEIMQNPSAVTDTRGEWLELYNPLGVSQNLEGWTLSDDGGAVAILQNAGAGIWLTPGGYQVFVRNDDPTVNGGISGGIRYSGFNLGNGMDQVILSRPDGTVVDRVGYDGGILWPDPTGMSMQLWAGVQSAWRNDNPYIWCSGISAYGSGDLGTPGFANDGC